MHQCKFYHSQSLFSYLKYRVLKAYKVRRSGDVSFVVCCYLSVNLLDLIYDVILREMTEASK